jgi:serine/threonine protein kinase
MDPLILRKVNHIDNKVSGYDEKVDIWSLGNICYQMLIGHCAFETNDVKILEKKIEKGNYNLPTCLHQESISFIIGMLQIDPTLRLSADELSRHKFLKKKFQDFTKINIKNLKNLIEGDKLILNIKEGRLLFNLFNKEYNKVLDIIPEDSEVPEENNKIQVSKSQINVDIKKTKMNISQNKKILKSNTNSIGLKEKLYKIFDKMNKDFLYLPPVFIPVIPGNNPNDDENEEKQI